MRARLEALDREIVGCFRCPRLVAWREQVAREKVARFRDEAYWGRPVPGFGDPGAAILIVGLAPAAHGGNRTGRVFTGDASGDFLWAALHRAGLADRPSSRRANDGLTLFEVRIAAAVRCAPPANRPTPQERDNCAPYLVRELDALTEVRVVVALGAFGWDAALRTCAALGAAIQVPRPRFGHLAEVEIGPSRDGRRWALLGSYHPSQQNTFTRRLTPGMFDLVIERAKAIAAEGRAELRAEPQPHGLEAAPHSVGAPQAPGQRSR